MAVGFSNRDAAHAMTRELIRAGYRRIVFVNGPTENNERARHRARGLSRRDEGGRAATRLPIHVVHDVGAIQPETGARIVRKLAAEKPDVDAVFFTSDVFAVGAILACRRARHRGAGAHRHRRLPRSRDRPGRLAERSPPCMCRRWRSGARPAQHDPRAPERRGSRASAVHELAFRIVERESTRRERGTRKPVDPQRISYR